MSAIAEPISVSKLTRAALREQIATGQLTLVDIAEIRPKPLWSMSLFALVLELPMVGALRLQKLNEKAVDARINLAVTLGHAPAETLSWLLEAVCQQPARPDDGTVSFSGEVLITQPDQETSWRLAAEGWETKARELDALIIAHERDVHDESLPIDRWATADERLHRRRAVVMSKP